MAIRTMYPGLTGLPRNWLAGLVLATLSGCACMQTQVEHALLTPRDSTTHALDLQRHYRVRYPDVLNLRVANRPDCQGTRALGLDGRIWLTPQWSLLVDGLTVAEIARLIARQVGRTEIDVAVKEYRSQHLYLFGEVGQEHQVVGYRGPETIVDVLRRIGQLPAGAALQDIRVVRAHVADGKPPEVFHIDLEAILLKRDQQTNIRVEPFDRIHVGRNRTSQLACCMPPWLRFILGQ